MKFISFLLDICNITMNIILQLMCSQLDTRKFEEMTKKKARERRLDVLYYLGNIVQYKNIISGSASSYFWSQLDFELNFFLPQTPPVIIFLLGLTT